MKSKISFDTALTIIVFYICLVYILFLRWYANMSPASAITFGVILITILGIKNIKLKNTGGIILSISILIIYILFNVSLTDSHKYIFDSVINHTFIPFFSTLLFLIINKKDDSIQKKYIYKPLFWILNIYYIVNFFVILKQISTPGFLIRNFSNNTFYLDQIDGFIGTNGTPRLMLLNISSIFINYIFLNDSKAIVRKISKFMFIFIIITSCYVSMFNDSRMYYFLLIIYMLPIIFNYFKKSFMKKKINGKTIKNAFKIIIIITVAIFIYFMNPSFQSLVKDKIINDYFVKTEEKLKNSNKSNNNGEERIELLKYSIENGDGMKIGKGIGSIPADGGLGMVNHFGLNDYNVRIYTGGIIYAVLVTYIYLKSYYMMVLKKNRKKSYYLFIIVTLIIAGIYTQVYTYTDKNFLLAMIYYLLAKIYNDWGEEKC